MRGGREGNEAKRKKDIKKEMVDWKREWGFEDFYNSWNEWCEIGGRIREEELGLFSKEFTVEEGVGLISKAELSLTCDADIIKKKLRVSPGGCLGSSQSASVQRIVD